MHPHLRTLVLALLLPVGVILAGAALAEPRGDRTRDWGKHRDRGPERFIEEHADELGLSPETRKAIEKIAADARTRGKTLREAASADREAMRELLQQPLPDEDEVMELTERLGASHLEAKQNRLSAMLAIRKLLTEEQRAKLVEIRESRALDRRSGGPLRSCREDVAQVCPEAEPGRSMLQCLSENWEQLSADCRASFERGGRHRARRGTREGRVSD